MKLEGFGVIGIIIFVVCCIGAAINWGYSAYYMLKTLRNYHPERQWGRYMAFSLFMPWFFTEEGNKHRQLLLKHMGYFLLLCLIGMAIGFASMKLIPNEGHLTPNTALKMDRANARPFS